MHPIIWLRRTVRLLALAGMLLVAGVLALLLLSGPQASSNPRREERVVSWWLRQVGRVFGVRISAHGLPCQHAVLYVSNHISWLDICVLGGLTRARFLSKADVKRWPLIGWLATRAGTLYIARGEKGASERALEQLVFQLHAGGQVVLFPEGTTTEGREVRRFHPRLFAAAQLARVPLQPVALRYPSDGTRRSLVPFVGDTTFAQHAFALMGEKEIRVEIRFLPMINPEQLDRRALAEATRAAIVRGLQHADPATADGGRGVNP